MYNGSVQGKSVSRKSLNFGKGAITSFLRLYGDAEQSNETRSEDHAKPAEDLRTVTPFSNPKLKVIPRMKKAPPGTMKRMALQKTPPC